MKGADVMETITITVNHDGIVHTFECVSAPTKDVAKILMNARHDNADVNLLLRVLDMTLST
jgi:hypothetical protein